MSPCCTRGESSRIGVKAEFSLTISVEYIRFCSEVGVARFLNNFLETSGGPSNLFLMGSSSLLDSDINFVTIFVLLPNPKSDYDD